MVTHQHTLLLSNTENPIIIDFLQTRKVAMTLRAINHKMRQNLLKLLDQNKRMTVTEVYRLLKVEQSVASQHLSILRKAGLVKTERQGKFVYYVPDYVNATILVNFVRDFLAKKDDK